MIYLNQTNNNEVIVTLYEGCTNIVNPYFTFELTDTNTKDVIVFTAEDHSNDTWYYNAFTVSVVAISGTTSPYGLTSGVIYANQGTYNYKVYEMATPYDLNTQNAIGVAEVGTLIINGTYSQYAINADSETVFVNKNLNFYDQ